MVATSTSRRDSYAPPDGDCRTRIATIMPASLRLGRTGAFRTGRFNIGNACHLSIGGKPGNSWGGLRPALRGESPQPRQAARIGGIVGEASMAPTRSVSATDLLRKPEALVRGHSYLPRRAAALLARDQRSGGGPREPELSALSARERTVIELYAKGFSAREMGKRMFLSPKTVEGYPGGSRAPGQPRGEVVKKAYRPYRNPDKCLTGQALRPVRSARFGRTAA